jgi:hypothetical protein
MNKKGEFNIMALFIPLLIALIVISIVIPLIGNKISTTTVTNDQFTASNTTCVQINTDYCIASLTSVANSTGTTPINTANFTRCNVADGTLKGLLLQGDDTTEVKFNGVVLNATYQSQDCNPVSGFTGTIIGFIPVFLALALLVFLALFIK